MVANKGAAVVRRPPLLKIMKQLSAYEEWQLKKYGNYIPEQSCDEFENSKTETVSGDPGTTDNTEPLTSDKFLNP